MDLRDEKIKDILYELCDRHQIQIRGTGNEIDVYYCPHCQEHQIDYNTEKNVYTCFKCGNSGNIITLYNSLEGAGAFQKRFENQSKKLNLHEINKSLHKKLRSSAGKVALAYFKNKRYYDDETIEKFQLGFADEKFYRKELGERHYHLKNCVTFPVFDACGHIINIRFKQVQDITPEKYFRGSVFNLQGYGSSTTNYIQNPKEIQKIYLFEGEPDAILAWQLMKYYEKSEVFQTTKILTGTAGANSIPPEWDEYFFRMPTTVFYDADTAGKTASKKISKISKTIRIADLSHLLINKEKDITDLVEKVGSPRAYKILQLLDYLSVCEHREAEFVEELNDLKQKMNQDISKVIRDIVIS